MQLTFLTGTEGERQVVRVALRRHFASHVAQHSRMMDGKTRTRR